ncbi:RING/U-box superfamily protein [Raphanus sativus]|uniref:Uncharacterized protein LOC108834335 n=1 Tax=Raphanus sativus TaxID=3726 RepID=A0A6J0LTK4_RAPSA|nr:uncharacterized protein LOC108834335 [Raphanus sativus]KAJ4908774.1 RING/U-box superfamily protein [Raphanus sativus]
MQNRVFYYPVSFSPRLRSNCRFSITLKTFRRDVYRHTTGKERLFGQTLLDPPLPLKFDIPSKLLASGSAETCLQHVSIVLKHVETRVLETVVLYAIQLFGESQGRTFELQANAEDVELHLMEESKGWTTRVPTKSIDVSVKECSICIEDLSDVDEESIVLHDCSHVFHKVCLLQWIWSKSSCPLCRHPIYCRKPKP